MKQSSKQLRKIVIIGRTNVGKSTLFNRLSSSVKSMALDYAGVTRDFVFDYVDWNGRRFELIDTGGIDFKKGLNVLTEAIRERAIQVLEAADIALFVVDGSIGVTLEDQALAKFVHKLNKPTILLINKSDTHATTDNAGDFYTLGFKNTVLISAQHGIGIADVLDLIMNLVPKEELDELEQPETRVELLGKPNVGKSSLMNLLVEKDRSLVSDIP